MLIFYGINELKTKQRHIPCFEILQFEKGIARKVLLDKCRGKTWTLVQSTGTPGEFMGYHTEEEEQEIQTLVWTRIYKGGGMLSLGEHNE